VIPVGKKMNLLLLLFTVAVAGQQTFDLQLRFVGVLPGNYETKVKDVDTGTVERDRSLNKLTFL